VSYDENHIGADSAGPDVPAFYCRPGCRRQGRQERWRSFDCKRPDGGDVLWTLAHNTVTTAAPVPQAAARSRRRMSGNSERSSRGRMETPRLAAIDVLAGTVLFICVVEDCSHCDRPSTFSSAGCILIQSWRFHSYRGLFVGLYEHLPSVFRVALRFARTGGIPLPLRWDSELGNGLARLLFFFSVNRAFRLRVDGGLFPAVPVGGLVNLP